MFEVPSALPNLFAKRVKTTLLIMCRLPIAFKYWNSRHSHLMNNGIIA
jgi:hypothetical protein